MSKTFVSFELSLPDFKKLLRLITGIITFSVLFVTGVIISVVEGAFVYEEVGFLSFTPLLICGLVLTVVSFSILTALFLTKSWERHEKIKYYSYADPPSRTTEQHGYRPVDHQL